MKNWKTPLRVLALAALLTSTIALVRGLRRDSDAYASQAPTVPVEQAALPQATTVDSVSAAAPAGFDAGDAPFTVDVNGESTPYARMAVFALPGEDVRIDVGEAGYLADADAGTLTTETSTRWSWRAPETVGTSELRVRRAADGAVVTLQAFVMVPYSEMKHGNVRGYYVGEYPAPRATHADSYARPRGFVQVTEQTASLALSPHFTLGQFVCKAGAGYPKYVVVQPRLLRRLENLLAVANQRGVAAHSFTLMSAYRTPTYNKGIGNVTTFTRHQYGDAADIFVDEDGDGRMDDLNHDGRFDRHDAEVLHDIAQDTERTVEQGALVGGLSAYAPTHEHGPFVHVDTRGFAARW